MGLQFLAILPYPFPIPASSVMAAARKNPDFPIQFNPADEESDDTYKAAFRFTEKYEDDQRKQVENRNPDRANDPNVQKARSMFKENFSLELETTGILKISSPIDLTGHDKWVSIAKNEMFWHFYHIAKSLFMSLKREGYVSNNAEYRPWASVLSEKPRRRLLQKMHDMIDDQYLDSRLALVDEFEKILRMSSRRSSRVIFPFRVLFASPHKPILSTKMVAGLTEPEVIRDFENFSVPLRELTKGHERGILDSYRWREKTQNKLDQAASFVAQSIDRVSQSMGLFLALAGILSSIAGLVLIFSESSFAWVFGLIGMVIAVAYLALMQPYPYLIYLTSRNVVEMRGSWTQRQWRR